MQSLKKKIISNFKMMISEIFKCLDSEFHIPLEIMYTVVGTRSGYFKICTVSSLLRNIRNSQLLGNIIRKMLFSV